VDPTTALQAIQSWPAEERVNFLFRLWDQLVADGWQPVPDEELAAELDRRLDAHAANPTDVRTWEQILERIRSRQ
jgi:putative addiction module component (TIGR02574 family)